MNSTWFRIVAALAMFGTVFCIVQVARGAELDWIWRAVIIALLVRALLEQLCDALTGERP